MNAKTLFIKAKINCNIHKRGDLNIGFVQIYLNKRNAKLIINRFFAIYLKVEYILGFGAAAVIVLTIIIVLILYLILQCRGQQRKRRAARRRAAGLCDTSSGGGAGDSYLERSTVDFIVPGIFEKDKRLFQSLAIKQNVV